MLESLNYSKLFGVEGGAKEIVYTCGYYGSTYKQEIIDWFTCGGIKRGEVVKLSALEQSHRKLIVENIIGKEKMEIFVGLNDVSLNRGYNVVGSSIERLEEVVNDKSKGLELGEDTWNALEDLYFFCTQFVRAIESGLEVGYKCRDEVDSKEIVDWLCDAVGSIIGRRDRQEVIDHLREAYEDMQGAYRYREDLLCELEDEDLVTEEDTDLLKEAILKVQRCRKLYFNIRDEAEEIGIIVEEYIKE